MSRQSNHRARARRARDGRQVVKRTACLISRQPVLCKREKSESRLFFFYSTERQSVKSRRFHRPLYRYSALHVRTTTSHMPLFISSICERPHFDARFLIKAITRGQEIKEILRSSRNKRECLVVQLLRNGYARALCETRDRYILILRPREERKTRQQHRSSAVQQTNSRGVYIYIYIYQNKEPLAADEQSHFPCQDDERPSKRDIKHGKKNKSNNNNIKRPRRYIAKRSPVLLYLRDWFVPSINKQPTRKWIHSRV